MSSQNPRFKTYRRILNSGLNPRAVRADRELQEREVRVLLRGLAKSPQDFHAQLRRNAGAVVLNLAYGWQVEENDDYLVSLAEDAFEISGRIQKPGRWLVDVIPILRFIPSWFPGAGFQREAAEARKQLSKIDSVHHTWAKKQIVRDYTPSFTSQHLKPEDGRLPTAEEEDILKWCTAAFYAGGADTTVAVMTTFILRITLHRDIQKRAQNEIDDVVGRDRFAVPEDEKRLPHVAALIQEVLRIAPVAPFGLPHRVTQDDEYLGYRIAKGATVIANICILSAFTILKPLNEKGQEVDPIIEYTSGVTSHAKPFNCRIVPRDLPLLSHILEF
ncbi:cytochrome P450 [Gloeophyllum trabeum ATCC 11539]|uniref:Cytochrome P450 n=1 Tax=Gloeophyllum trabeum (strain ATCC 11539 / FP-39264 / Madison 617) TaxID=670483 RepID=S7RRJ5_GLOTA|nr:cytochrome P450 [Gloeophyllum trabeum ATCC 11539]EPQ55579.1 cytochrome P450 [Gloeophyllum trabeum ATCC 11539]